MLGWRPNFWNWHKFHFVVFVPKRVSARLPFSYACRSSFWGNDERLQGFQKRSNGNLSLCGWVCHYNLVMLLLIGKEYLCNQEFQRNFVLGRFILCEIFLLLNLRKQILPLSTPFCQPISQSVFCMWWIKAFLMVKFQSHVVLETM